MGKVFIEHVPRMTEVYKIYCHNHDDATAMLEKLEYDLKFQLPLQECLSIAKYVTCISCSVSCKNKCFHTGVDSIRLRELK